MGAHVKSAGPQLTFPVYFSRCFPSLFKVKMREHQCTNKLSIKANNWEGNKPPTSAEQIRSEMSLNMVHTPIRPVSHAGAASRDMSSLPTVSLGVKQYAGILQATRSCFPARRTAPGSYAESSINDPKARTGSPLSEHMPDPPHNVRSGLCKRTITHCSKITINLYLGLHTYSLSF